MKRDSIGIFLVLTLTVLIVLPELAMGVEEFRVSENGGGVQIWFEAEAFDERNPEGDRYFKITGEKNAPKTPDDAFGEAVTRSGGPGGMIRWTFDISRAGGEGGDWRFWARILNPSNQSDYMLVEGDRDDDIPDGPPFPGGDGAAPFSNPDDRIFEQSVPIWSWWGNSEGSSKELQDGENSMFIFHRQGNETVFWDVFMWTDSTYAPNDDDYANAEVMSKIAVQPLKKLSATWGNIKDAACIK